MVVVGMKLLELELIVKMLETQLLVPNRLMLLILMLL